MNEDNRVKTILIYYMSCGDVIWRDMHSKLKPQCVTHPLAFDFLFERHTVWVKE